MEDSMYFGNYSDQSITNDFALGNRLANLQNPLMTGMMYAPILNRIKSSNVQNMLGVETEEQKKQRILQEIASKLDSKDPDAIMLASSELMRKGFTQEAQQLMKYAQDIISSRSQIELRNAQIGKENALANKYGADAQNAITGKDKTFVIDRKLAMAKQLLDEGTITPEKYNSIVQEIIASNQDLTDARINAANRQGLPAPYNAASIKEGEVGYASPEDVAKLQAALSNGKGTGVSEGKSTEKERLGKLVGDLTQKLIDGTITPSEAAELQYYTNNPSVVKNADNYTASTVEFASTAYSLDNQIEGFKRDFLGNVPEADRTKVYSVAAEFGKYWLANQDKRSAYIQRFNEIASDQVFAKLKQLGSANYSNADLEFARNNIPTADSSPDFVFEWLNRMQKGARETMAVYDEFERSKAAMEASGIKPTKAELAKLALDAKRKVVSSANGTVELRGDW